MQSASRSLRWPYDIRRKQARPEKNERAEKDLSVRLVCSWICVCHGFAQVFSILVSFNVNEPEKQKSIWNWKTKIDLFCSVPTPGNVGGGMHCI